MLPINIYPYLDITDLNLDSILKSIKSLSERLNNFVALNTIKYANPIQWNITRQYEMNTVVIDPISGTAYLSVAPVPSGVSLTNKDYWIPIFTLNLLSANQNITLRDDANNVIATFESDEGNWLIWNYTLYRVTRHIDLSQAYVVGYNLERYTVELFIKDYITALENVIGDIDDLTTTDKNNLVAAINELKSNVGNIDDLTTTNKDNLVEAINEIDQTVNNVIVAYVTPEQFGAAGDGVADDTQAIVDALNAGAVCVCSKTYRTTSPISIPTYKKLIVLGIIDYQGVECAIKMDHTYCGVEGWGMVQSSGNSAIEITRGNSTIKHLRLYVSGNYTACISIVSNAGNQGVGGLLLQEILMYGRDSNAPYGKGIYIHTTNDGWINENLFDSIFANFFVDGIHIHVESSNGLNRNKFTRYDGENSTHSLYAYSTGSYLMDNHFDFRTEEFSSEKRIWIDNHVASNIFSGHVFMPKSFGVINPTAKTLWTNTASVLDNIIEGKVATNSSATYGFNGSFVVNGDIVVFDVNSKREGLRYYTTDTTFDYSDAMHWVGRIIEVSSTTTDITFDLNYHSDFCHSPIEYIQLDAASTTLTIKNDTTILYGPTALPKGIYQAVYTPAANLIRLAKLSTV